MSSGRLAAVGAHLGTTVMFLVCAAIVIGALLVFTWLLIETVDRVAHHVQENSASSTASWPPGRNVTDVTQGFVTDVPEPGRQADGHLGPGRLVQPRRY